jgi:hypothetical protein
MVLKPSQKRTVIDLKTYWEMSWDISGILSVTFQVSRYLFHTYIIQDVFGILPGTFQDDSDLFRQNSSCQCKGRQVCLKMLWPVQNRNAILYIICSET